MATIVRLRNGYSRTQKPQMMTFRVITLQDVKSWAIPQPSPCTCDGGQSSFTLSDADHAARYNAIWGTAFAVGETIAQTCGSCNGTGTAYRDTTPQHIWFKAMDGSARQCKINGAVKTWKRDHNRVEVPVKYGLYEYATFTASDIEEGRLLEAINA